MDQIDGIYGDYVESLGMLPDEETISEIKLKVRGKLENELQEKGIDTKSLTFEFVVKQSWRNAGETKGFHSEKKNEDDVPFYTVGCKTRVW